MTEMAKRFGLEEKFTEGRTQKEWIRWGYEQTLAKRQAARSDQAPGL